MQQQQQPAGPTERRGEAAPLPAAETTRLATLGPGFTSRQRAHLIFMRWLYLRGALTDFPAGTRPAPAGSRFRSRW